MKHLPLLLILLSTSLSSLALPKEIIIIRHSDKNPAHHGQTLDPTGYLRAIKFAAYYKKHFKNPNYIIASNPLVNGKLTYSLRELQTVAPLINQLQSDKVKFHVLTPYKITEFKKLPNYLKQKQFDNKTVLICWDHKFIPKLVNALGVKTTLPVWKKFDYNSVYDIHYNTKQNVTYRLSHNQYPQKDIASWAQITNFLKK